ncbi:MAG: DUF362 domain-containing protein [Deltaproteobacteria bacterium]
MKSEQSMTRRESIKKLLRLWGGFSLGGTAVLSWPAIKPAQAVVDSPKFLVDGVGRTEGYSIKALTRKTFEAAGGMGSFVSKGDVVAIKPNISWARAPHLAATTNPEVLEAVIELCQEAGAKKVRIVDHTIHGAKRCFAVTGAGMVAKNTGADLVHPRSSLMRDMKMGGNRLDVWPVFMPVVEADTLINLPVAKVHGLSGLTLGMKNWIGAVGGRRNALHQDIHQTIVDLAHYFKPDVTLIDATRVMVHNGPSGGSLSDVVVMNRLILSNDPVAADARAARLFDFEPDAVGFIKIGHQQGLGVYDTAISRQREVAV